MPVEIFCCYAYEDELWLRKLEKHLNALKQQGLVSGWYDRLIVPGTNWSETIDTHLETASIVLLLVSADFFTSDYCVGSEMKRALERQEAGEALVIPILVSRVYWRETLFAHLQALPTDATPLTAWDDEETALANVAAGIRRAIEDLSVLVAGASRAELPAIWNIPYSRNPFFLGRDNELAQVRHHLQVDQAAALSQPQAISGLGGIGKSQLALEYAYRYHPNYQAVLWARADSTDALISSYIALATLLRLPEREAREQDITVQAVKTWLQTHRDWLLILDNADELMLLPDFLPPSLGGHLLLTTRAIATGRLAHRLEIETLVPEQAALFLLRRASLIAPDAELSQVSYQERELALQISRELGGLPLALDQAGAYIEEIGIDLSSYWQIYQQHRAELLLQRGGMVADHPAPVATTWSLSFRRVEERNPAAAELLRLCAYLAPDAIPEEILTAGASLLGPVLAPVAADAFRRNQAIEALRAYSLVRRDPKEKTLSIHRLVQAVLQDMLEEQEKSTWVERAMLAVNATFPERELRAWSQWERVLPHALLAVQLSKTHQVSQIEVGHLLNETASYLLDRARYQEAEPLFQRALMIYERELRAEHSDMAALLNNLALLYKEQGKYAEAEELYLRVMKIYERQLRPEDAQIALTLNRLGGLYYQRGNYVEAEPLFQRALHIVEQQFGPEDTQVANPLNNLASVYMAQGKYTVAEPLFERALRIYEQQLGPEHSQVAYPLNNLAILNRKQGKYAEAEPLFERALRIIEQQLGPEHPQVAIPLNNLAELYQEQGKYAEAEMLFEHALRIWEQQLGPEHPNVAATLANLAELYREQGKYAEAEPLFERALRIFEPQLAPDHPDLASMLNGLATLYLDQGKYAEAEPLFERALRICELVLESQHRDTAEVIFGLARLREAQGTNEEARTWYTRALAIRQQALGDHHRKTIEAREYLIALLHAMGEYEE